MNCRLALEDGTVFYGQAVGAEGTACGEAVFNTAMTGYQEVLTDPSYHGQIVTLTYPLIGNYGVNEEDLESGRLYLSGFVVKQLAPLHSHHRAVQSLGRYLEQHGVVGLSGVDTRAITRRLRDHGALRAVISTASASDDALCAKARALPLMSGQNLAARVAGHAPAIWKPQTSEPMRYRVVALDCGIKYNILRCLANLGCEVVCLSGLSSPEQVLEHHPDGILVGNGPGDPSAADDSIRVVGRLLGEAPMFGICLGQQLLGCALGAQVYKLKFGHHGANHPVLNLATDRVEITSQNHGFAVATESLAGVGAVATHTNLNDRSLEGFAHPDHALFAVQFHPEAAPGPHDSHYLFGLFLELMRTGRLPEALVR